MQHLECLILCLIVPILNEVLVIYYNIKYNYNRLLCTVSAIGYNACPDPPVTKHVMTTILWNIDSYTQHTLLKINGKKNVYPSELVTVYTCQTGSQYRDGTTSRSVVCLYTAEWSPIEDCDSKYYSDNH